MIRKLLPHLRRHLADVIRWPEGLPAEDTPQPEPSYNRAQFGLALLRAAPWLCWGLFGASLWWDFPGWQLSIADYSLPLQGLLRMLGVSGLIGYYTNWLAIKMLFYPRQKRPLLGQGLVPAQQGKLAHRLAHSIHQHLLNEQVLLERIQKERMVQQLLQRLATGLEALAEDPDFNHELHMALTETIAVYLSKPEVQQKLEQELDAVIREAVEGTTLPRLYLKLNQRKYQKQLHHLVAHLPDKAGAWLQQPGRWLVPLTEALHEREDELEKDLSRLLRQTLESLQIPAQLQRQLAGYDASRLEQLLWGSTNEQLLYIQYLGGWLGIVGGLVLWQPLPMLALLLGVGSLVWVLDEILYRKQAPTNLKNR